MSKGFFSFFSPMSTVAMADYGEKLLYAFAKSYNNLNNIINDTEYTIKNTPQWYKLLEDLGTSFTHLYLFHTHIIKNHPYFQKHPDEVKYISFFMDMNASQLKNNFFKEEPGAHFQYTNLSTKSLKDIYKLGVRILDDLPEEEMRVRLYLFYHKIFVTYDYIYDSTQNNQGAFTQFLNSAEKYDAGIGVIQDLIKKISTSSSMYRKQSMFIIQDVMRKQILPGDELPEDKYANNFFSTYLKEYYQTHPLEPVSYILAHKLWKINKVIEHRFEQHNEEAFDQIFVEKIKNYILEQIAIGKQYYQDYDIGSFALKTYVSDLEFSKFIFSDIHHRNIDIELKKESTLDKKIVLSPLESTKIKHDAVESALTKIHKDGSKFNKIFNDGTVEEITHTIYMLERAIPLDKEDHRLVGLYRSGALMAHCINVINGLRKEVFLFTSFPYIGLHPTSCNIRDKYNDFIIVDESYKTGFTNLLSMIYIARGKDKKDFQTVALADFMHYPKISLTNHYFDYNITSIANINRYSIQLRTLSTNISQKYDLQKYFKGVDTIVDTFETNSEQFEKFKQDVKDFALVKNDHEIYYDVTRVLSHTNLLFIIAVYFWKKIKTHNQINYFLHAPSDEGRLIAEAIALVAKMIEKKAYRFTFKFDNIKNESERIFKKVFVDLTIDSGTNLEHSLKKDIVHKDIKEHIFTFYDDIVVVLTKQGSNLKLKRDIISIYNY